MKNYNYLKALSENFFKDESQRKQEERDSEEINRQNDLDYEERSMKLQKKEQDLAKKKIVIFKEEESVLLEDIKCTKSPVNINFDGNEDLVADRYIHLKKSIPILEIKRDEIRAESLSKAQIILAEFAATAFFIFILTRLAADNIDLIKSFVFVSTFENLYGLSTMTLYADMVLQDYPIVLAISYIAAISFKNNDGFFHPKLKTKLLYAFGFFIIGLFVSSMLFSY